MLPVPGVAGRRPGQVERGPAVRELVQSDQLTPRGGRMYWSGERSPAAGVGLRSGSSVEYRLVDAEADRTIGTVDAVGRFATERQRAGGVHGSTDRSFYVGGA